MTNRILGILIILGFIGVGYLYYTLQYLPNNTNISQNTINKVLSEEVEKKIELVELKKIDKKQNILSTQEKIEKIKLENKFYKIIELEGNNKVYFKNNGDKLELFLGNKFIGSFDLIEKNNLRVEFIKGDYSNLYLEIGMSKYIYSLKTNIITSLDINLEVLYLKKGLQNTYLVVTNKGTFIYKIYENKFEYFSLFNDFIYSNDGGYIGIINKNDTRRLKNMGFDNKNKNLIVFYDWITKEKKILLSIDFKINEIYSKNGDIIVFDTEGNEYILNNN